MALLYNPIVGVALALAVAACGSDRSAYERAVAEEEPVYCYQTLAGIDCYRTPAFRDERTLVNFYGPRPADFERPEAPEPAELTAPPEVDHYCRVSEPDACALPPVVDAEVMAPPPRLPVPRPAPEPPVTETTDAPADASPDLPPLRVIDPPQET